MTKKSVIASMAAQGPAAASYMDNRRRVLFALGVMILFALSVFRVKPDIVLWERPLAAHSYAQHHTIISVLDDLYRDKNFLKGDLAVEAIKREYFMPHKYLQIFLVNKIGIRLFDYVNALIIAGLVANFIGIGLLAYWFTRRRIAILLALFCFVFSNGHNSIKDVPDNFTRFLAQGICFISLWLFLKKRYLSAIFVCALAFVFHYGMPFYLLLLFFLYLLFYKLSLNGKNLFTAALMLSLISMAVIILLPKDFFAKGMNIRLNFELWKKIVYDTGSCLSYLHVGGARDAAEAVRWAFYNLKNITLNLMIPLFFFWVGIRELEQKRMLKYVFAAYAVTQIIHLSAFDIAFLPIFVKAMIINTWSYMSFFILLIYTAVVTKYIYKEKLKYGEVVMLYLFSAIYFIYNLEMKKAVSFPLMFCMIFLFIAIYKGSSLSTIKRKAMSVGRRALMVVIPIVLALGAVLYFRVAGGARGCLTIDSRWLQTQSWAEKNTDTEAVISYLLSAIDFLRNPQTCKLAIIAVIFCLVLLIVAIRNLKILFLSRRGVTVDGRRAFTILFLLILIFSITVYYRKIREMREYAAKDSYWFEAQLWARENTDKDAKFIIPFSGDNFHGMRIYGKRSVMCLKAMELHLVAILDTGLMRDAIKEFASPWKVIKEDGVPVDFSKYDLLEYSKFVGNNLNREDLLLLKKDYGNLSYIVTDCRDIPGLPMMYANKYYKIFEIK